MPNHRTLLPDLLLLSAALASYEGVIAAHVTAAATRPVERELRRLVREEHEVHTALADEIRTLGGTPARTPRDLPTPAAVVSKLAAPFVPRTEALLTEAVAARAIADRSHVLRASALAQGDTNNTADVCHAVGTFYRLWADWLVTTVSDLAIGAPARLDPTPGQVTASRAKALLALPSQLQQALVTTAAGITDLGVNVVQTQVATVRDAALEAAGTARAVVRKTRDVTSTAALAGRDAALEAAEHEAREVEAPEVAETINETRRVLGVGDEADLPIAGYGAKTAAAIAREVTGIHDLDQLEELLAHERAHKGRATVTAALVRHTAAVTRDLS